MRKGYIWKERGQMTCFSWLRNPEKKTHKLLFPPTRSPASSPSVYRLRYSYLPLLVHCVAKSRQSWAQLIYLHPNSYEFSMINVSVGMNNNRNSTVYFSIHVPWQLQSKWIPTALIRIFEYALAYLETLWWPFRRKLYLRQRGRWREIWGACWESEKSKISN